MIGQIAVVVLPHTQQSAVRGLHCNQEGETMAEIQKCAHPACNCMAAKDSKYCSEYCHDAKDTLELACSCGHPGCEEKLAPALAS